MQQFNCKMRQLLQNVAFITKWAGTLAKTNILLRF